jgi:hypothetical protein
MQPFVDRTLSATVRRASASFPVVLLTGPPGRQDDAH